MNMYFIPLDMKKYEFFDCLLRKLSILKSGQPNLLQQLAMEEQFQVKDGRVIFGRERDCKQRSNSKFDHQNNSAVPNISNNLPQQSQRSTNQGQPLNSSQRPHQGQGRRQRKTKKLGKLEKAKPKKRIYTTIKKNNSRVRTDKHDFKTYSSILKNIYEKLVKKGEFNPIPKQYSKYKYRMDYFIMILNLFEKQGGFQKCLCFQDYIPRGRIQSQRQNQLIQRHLESLHLFVQRKYSEAISALFNYPSLQRKDTHAAAQQFCTEMRKELYLRLNSIYYFPE